MKRLLLLIVSLFIMSAYATTDDPTTIIVQDSNGESQKSTQAGNKAPARRIFSGYYSSSAGAVAIFFHENIGQATITVDGAEGMHTEKNTLIVNFLPKKFCGGGKLFNFETPKLNIL